MIPKPPFLQVCVESAQLEFSKFGFSLDIIDCQGKNRHISIDGTRNITLIGITLMNGDSGHEDGGCVSMTRGVLTFKLVDSLLVNCRSGGSGGAIHVSIRSLIDIRRSEFDGLAQLIKFQKRWFSSLGNCPYGLWLTASVARRLRG